MLGYLPNHLQAETERRMRAAYGMETYSLALAALKKLMTWLRAHSEAAAKSLAEA